MKLEDYSEIINRCSQCNFCQGYCPSYLAERTENFVARHRVNLIKEVLIDKTAPDTEKFREILSKCLLCTSCSRNCFSLVPVDEVVISARSELLKNEKGLGALKRGFMSKVLREKGLRNIAGIAGTVAGKLGLSPRNMPQISSSPFDSKYKGTIKAQGEQKGRVVYFAGCGSNFLFPEVGAAVVKVLTANGIETVIPETLTCCGVPLISDGDIEGAAEMMKRNVETLSAIEADAIVMDCSSCRMMFMKKAAKLFDKDDPIQQKIISLIMRLREPAGYLREKGIRSAGAGMEKTFTLHVPCHSDRTSEKNLLSLLQSVSGRYIEMENPESCCGAGGMFYMDNGEISENIRKSKIDAIEQTGAQAVVTECPMCRFYIKQGLPGKEVMHPFEFVARNL